MERRERARINRLKRKHSRLWIEAERLRRYTERMFFDGVYLYSAEFYGRQVDKSTEAYREYVKRSAGLWWRLWQMERSNRLAAGWKPHKTERDYCRTFHNRRAIAAEVGVEIPKGPFRKAKRPQDRASRNEHLRTARGQFVADGQCGDIARFDKHVLALLAAAERFAPLTKTQQAEAAEMRKIIAGRAKQPAA